jgi:hypothetical protein
MSHVYTRHANTMHDRRQKILQLQRRTRHDSYTKTRDRRQKMRPSVTPLQWGLIVFLFVGHLILVTPDGSTYGVHFYPDFHWLWLFHFDTSVGSPLLFLKVGIVSLQTWSTN